MPLTPTKFARYSDSQILRMGHFVVVTLLAPICAFAEPEERPVNATIPIYEVKHTTDKITIDGRIDEVAWRDAKSLTLQFPWEGQTGDKQKTTVRLLWDDDFLYVAYDCEDHFVTAHYDHRDDPTYKDDAVEIFINPRPVLDIYVGVEMNAKAILYDYVYVFPYMLLKKFDLQSVKLATHLDGTLNSNSGTDKGWQLEVAIPLNNFSEITRNAPIVTGTIWTINLCRWDGTEPNRRLSVWSDSGMVQPNPHNPKRFGRLVFVK